jgi:hypothetical protein
MITKRSFCLSAVILFLLLAPPVSKAQGEEGDGAAQAEQRRQEKLKAALSSAEEQLSQGDAQLKKTVIGYRENCTDCATPNIYGYDAEKVVAVIADGKSQLMSRLEGKELAGLRAYVGETYPAVTLESLGAQPVIGASGGGPKWGVEIAKKDKAFDEAQTFVGRVKSWLSSNPTTVNLQISSQPPNAEFEMWADGAQPEKTRTGTTLTNVYRGLYRYKVTKSGYKEIVGAVNLVDREGTHLTCLLYSLSDSESAQSCTLN